MQEFVRIGKRFPYTNELFQKLYTKGLIHMDHLSKKVLLCSLHADFMLNVKD